MILAHELGHYTMARVFDVHILEFSIGMGPKIFSRKSKKTGIVYSLRALPIGGFVQMVGENGEDEMNEREKSEYGAHEDDGADGGSSEKGASGESAPVEGESQADDPRALSKKPIWQRLLILAAGGVTNIVIGIILTFVLVMTMQTLGSTVIGDFNENATSNAKLQAGDVVVRVKNTPVTGHMMLAYSIMHSGNKPIDITVVRGADIVYNDDGEVVSYSGGERIVLEDVVFPPDTVDEYGGAVFGDMDFRVYRAEKNFGSVIQQSLEYSAMMIKTVWDGLFDLIRGRYGFEAVSGPVGVSSEIGSAAKSGP